MDGSPFYKNWLTNSVKNYLNIWNFSEDSIKWFYKSSKWNLEYLKKTMLDSTAELYPELGDNPVVALSGGIDSQMACLALKKVGAKFSAAIMKFNDDWNYQDVLNAEYFCSVNGIQYTTYELQIFDFLQIELKDYVKKYMCPSPQLCCHHWLLEQINNDGASGILLGGDAPTVEIENGIPRWDFAASRSQASWIGHQEINNIVIRSWKSWSREIAGAFTVTLDSDPSTNARSILA
jgi:hypothetical protein